MRCTPAPCLAKRLDRWPAHSGALGGSGAEPLECVLPAPGFGSAADFDCWPDRAPRGVVAVISLPDFIRREHGPGTFRATFT